MRSAWQWGPVAALLLALPLAARAQEANAWRDSLVRIAAQVQVLHDSLVQGDSGTVEIARHGNTAVAASLSQRDAALAAVHVFDSTTGRWFSGAVPSPDGFRIVVRTEQRRADEDRQYDVDRKVGSVVLAGLPDTGRAVRVQRTTSPVFLASTLIDGFNTMMFEQLTPRLHDWLAFAPPITTSDHERRNLAMYLLVTGTGPAQRACVRGDVQGCALALDVRRGSDSSAGGPFPPLLRADLLLTALDIGGPGAWSRFRDTGADGLEPALAAAAGIPADSLLVRWRAQLLAMRPTASPLTPSIVVLALGWTALALAGALGASRWG
ncbi:MAG TPA: hypothetical protein VGL65_13445 [Gemmatimonadales bacterium]|jgi:hypothetical protein